MRTYSFSEATAYLKTSETTMTELVVHAVIPGAKIGQSWVFREDDLDAYLRKEVDRQTAERIEQLKLGGKVRVKTARGNRTPILDLSKYSEAA